MKHFVGKMVIFVIMVSNIIACTSKLAYKKDMRDPASPGDKELVFSLRNSTILISQSGTEKKPEDGKKVADQADSVTIVSSCPAQQGEKPITPPITLDNLLTRCLFQVNAKASAIRDTSEFYVATPEWGTTLTSTAVDADPLMVKSITVNYKNPTVGIVTSAGAGAATGFGIGGPWGAAIGGLLAGVGAAISASMRAEEWKYENDVCQEDIQSLKPEEFKGLVSNLKAVNVDPPQLFLPIALDYKTSKNETKCWHPLPNLSDKALDAVINNRIGLPPLSGWFYRIVAVDPKSDSSKLPPILPTALPHLENSQKTDPPFQYRIKYFEQEREKYLGVFNIANYQETFPVSACRSVELQITWWEMLKYRKPNDEAKHYKYPMMVANSEYVQAIRLPKNGTVNLLPVCGGYASPTQSSSSLGEVIDAVVKQAQAVKEAQAKYKKQE